MGMDEILAIREWLNDCKVLSPSEVRSFTSTVNQNNEIIQSIFTILEDRNKNHEVLEGICSQLFSFYQTRDCELQRFVLQYLPTMICIYLTCLTQADRKCVKYVEVLLLGIYNLEIVDTAGKPKIHNFRLPSVAQPSIYHVPLSLTSASLTENSLSRLDKGDTQMVAIGPFLQVENLNAQNRLKVMTVLMNVYNRNLSYMRKVALHALCKMCSRLVKQGFNKPNSHHRSSFGSDSIIASSYSRAPPRVPLSSAFLLEVLHGIYFSMFNGLGTIGLQTLDDVHYRATKELMVEVLLVTNGVRNSIRTNPSGQLSEGPMGISISISPTTSMTTVHKSIITNASFRTRKLPDDIPIQTSKDDIDDSQKCLATISEETEDGTDKVRQNAKVKEKEKGKAPLIGMISKIGGSRGKEKNEKGTGGGILSTVNVGIVNNPLAGVDGRKKELEVVAASKINSKDIDSVSKSSMHNGDALGSVKDACKSDSVNNAKNPSRNQMPDMIEMKNLKQSGKKLSDVPVEHLSPIMGEEMVDGGSDTGSLSSTHSSLDEEQGSFQILNQIKTDKGTTNSNTQIHTTV